MRRLTAVVLLLGVTACGTPAAEAPQAPSPTASSATAGPASPTPASPSPVASVPASPTPTGPLSPFTGLPAAADAPVLLVKLDNTTFAQPHVGLTRADLVIVEPVEYGLTRLAAVFSSDIPDRIGPVRSARITDIDLASLLAHPVLTFSGAQHLMYPVLQAAPIDLVTPATRGEGFVRDRHRHAPYNEFVDGTVALARAVHDHGSAGSPARDIGLTFDDQAPPGGVPATHARVTWPESSATFDYDATDATYAIRLNGRPAGDEADPRGPHAASVVITFVNTPNSVFHDRFGGFTPRAQVIGTGRAVILRDGRAYDATWTRTSADAPMTLTGPDGTAIPLHPGQQWWLLADVRREARIRATITAGTATASYASQSASSS